MAERRGSACTRPVARSSASALEGERVYVGSREDGLAIGASTGAFAKGAPGASTCLAAAGGSLWSCGTDKQGYLVGVSRNHGTSFDPKLRLEDVKAPLACPAESTVAKVCAELWPKQRRDLGLGDEPAQPRDPGGPALRGVAGRRTSSRNPLRIAFGVAAAALLAYGVIQRLRRR